MPIKDRNPDSIRQVMNAVAAAPWHIYEPAAQQLLEVLDLRRQGLRFTDEEIEQRIGGFNNRHFRAGMNLEEGRFEDVGPRIASGVAILPLWGVMAPKLSMLERFSGGTSTVEFSRWYQQALDNDRVKSILIDADSPGGQAVWNEELSTLIRNSRGAKTVKTVFTNLGASACYYVGSSAEEVIASPSASVGSVGTVYGHVEYSKANEEAGETWQIVRAGENKMLANSVEPLSDKARLVVQEQVDSHYDMFISAVAKNRGVSVEHVEKNFGQGKVMIASKAMEAGLIDRVATLEDVFLELSTEARNGGSTSQRGSSQSHSAKDCKMLDPKLITAMVTAGLIPEGTEDSIANIALDAFFTARNQERPEDVGAIIEALNAPLPLVATLESTNGGEGNGPLTVTTERNWAPVSAGDFQQTTEVDVVSVRNAEKARIQNLQTRGELLHMTQQQINAAIDNNVSVEDALMEWTEQKSGENGTVGKLNVGVTEASEDKFSQGAIDALAIRAGLEVENPSPYAKHLQYKSLAQIAEESLSITGKRAPVGDPEEVAAMALRGTGADIIIRNGEVGAYNRPGDFPHLMANLAGKMMDIVEQYSPATYKQWASRIASVSDFKPRTLIATGAFGELPQHKDGEKYEESDFGEEASWIAVDEFGDEFKLTPRMIADDDLGGFEDLVRDKQVAHDLTLNRLCVNLLTGNVDLPDEVALFHADHANLVTGGAVPDTDQLSKMRLLLRKQKGIKNRRTLNLTLKMILAPTDLETGLDKLLNVNQTIIPEDVAKADLFRGSVRHVIEPMLDESSAAKYYGFADPRLARAIVYMHQRGYEKARTRMYWQNETNCRVLQVTGRMAAAVRNFRGVVENPGA